MNKMPTSTSMHPIVRAVGHRHFIRGFHLSSMAVAIWAVAMVFVTVATFETPVRADTGSTVTGRVLASGTAVPAGKVQIYIMSQGQGPSGPPAQTDAGGVFTLYNVAPGSGYMLQVQIIDPAFAYLGAFFQNMTVTNGSNNVGDINLTAAPKTLTVTVTRSATGASVSNVQVNAFQMGGVGGPGPNATTDASGTATMRMSGGMWGLNLQAGYGQTADWVYTGQ